jgi:ribosomal protein S18 acetylase RimI-like enzyme
MQIEVITEDKLSAHISSIAAIHKKAYHNDHFTSKFAMPKLEEYYSYLIKNSDLPLIALSDQGDCVGFIISGTTVYLGIQEFVRVNRTYLLGVMFRNPNFLIQKVYFKAYSFFKKSRPSSARFRLLSISVDPECQSTGVGGIMLKFFESKLASMNIESYGLSVRTNNARAVQFYINNGFVKEKEYLSTTYFYRDITTRL